MKWIVAGAGVLLSIAGLYGLVTGASIIQVERGWASFIAGAVALSAGVLTLAIAAVITRIEQLVIAWTGASFARADAQHRDENEAETFRPLPPVFSPVVAEKPAPEPAPERDAPMFSDLPPLRGEITPAVEPVVEATPPSLEPQSLDPAPVMGPRKDERSAGLRDFKFVFPPIEDEKRDEKSEAPALNLPPLEPQDKVEPLKSVESKPATRFNLGWLRRNRDEVPATSSNTRVEPDAFVAPEPAPQAEQESARAAEPDATETQTALDTVRVEINAESAVDDRRAAAPVAEEAIASASAPAPDPFSSDWLERALSGADETQSSAPPPRFVPPSQRRAAQAEVASVHAEPAAEPQQETTSAEAPVEIGRYSANDVAYIMYSDGSITAETANGTFRFHSLIELKDFIERGA